MKSPAVLLAVLVCLGASTFAQAQTADSRAQNQTPTYGVNIVSRTTRAVQYEHRSGSTKIDFKGTNLMPGASGEAKVESKRGAMEIEVEFRGLDKPTSFGTEYLTYVLWAISPEGRSVNVGEVLVGDSHRSKLNVTTDLQAFALIVTAEPYYAVRRLGREHRTCSPKAKCWCSLCDDERLQVYADQCLCLRLYFRHWHSFFT